MAQEMEVHPVLNTLRFGSFGPQVELLQLGLQRAGYLRLPPDGVFGPLTRAALLRFQRENGLTADGIAGPLTWAALNPWLIGSKTVTVRSGDTLYKLATANGVSLRAVETANPGVDPLALQPGQTLTIPLPFEVVPDNIRFTSTVLRLVFQGLRARYPFLAVDSIGDSVLGTPLYMMKIGSGPNQVFYNGAHHANEWITSPLLAQFLERYAAAYATGGQIGGYDAGELYRKSTLFLVPMVNPDGVDLVTGEIGPGNPYYFTALALNGGLAGFPSDWKANINGVDLNLQYPAGWEEAKEIKFAQGYTRPGPRDYVGQAPLSQPESRAVYDFTMANNFALTMSYHTQGEVIYWKYLDQAPPRGEEIGRRLSQLSGYALEDTPPGSAYAGYKDWFIKQFNRPGYTIEAGSGTNPLPLSQLPEIYNDNVGMLSYGLTAPAAG